MIKFKILELFLLFSFSFSTSRRKNLPSKYHNSFEDTFTDLNSLCDDNFSIVDTDEGNLSQSIFEIKSNQSNKRLTDFSIDSILRMPKRISSKSNDSLSLENTSTSCKNLESSKNNFEQPNSSLFPENKRNLKAISDSNSENTSEHKLQNDRLEFDLDYESVVDVPFISYRKSEVEKKPNSLKDSTPIISQDNRDCKENSKSSTSIFKSAVEVEETEFYEAFIEFLARIIFFRNSIHLFIHENLIRGSTNARDLKETQNSDNNHQYSASVDLQDISSLKDTSFMSFVKKTLDYSYENEKNFKSFNGNVLLTQRLSFGLKKIGEYKSRISGGNLSEKVRDKLLKKIKDKANQVSQLQKEKTILANAILYRPVTSYLKTIIKPNFDYSNFIIRWISIFLPLTKILIYYDKTLKETLEHHLERFRCPFDYKDRELMVDYNCHNLGNNFLFIIIDWMLYFFSDEFQRDIHDKASNSKILSRITAFIILIFNDSNTIKYIMTGEGLFDEWIERLEDYFYRDLNSNSPNDIFGEFGKNIKEFNGIIHISKSNFYNKIMRRKKLEFLNNLKQLIKRDLGSMYSRGIYIYLLETLK